MFYHSIKYDVENYNFQKVISDEFGVDDLKKLHNYLENQYSAEEGVAGLGNDTHSKFHNMFYAKLNSGWPEFEDAWNGFVKNIIKPLFSKEGLIIFQTYPSFRIQYPSSKAITTWHYDSDENHQHPLGEINIIIPITKMYGNNTVWKESLPGLGDFAPMELKIGEAAMWDGNRCRHGNKKNDTGETRISFDFRILPRMYYSDECASVTATTGKKFVIGEYYSEV